MIHVRDLRKSFGRRTVLNGLALEVEPGAVTLMVGANGAGKTTTLRVIAGLSTPDAGTITIAGHDLERERSAALAHLAFLPQAPRFHPRLTVRQTAEFYGELRGRLRGVDVALDLWGLDEFSRVPTGKLSGGLRQRLALALVSLADTPVILMDEPGLSLDPDWRRRLQTFLKSEAARGRTVLIATHLLGEWDGRIDRCILIDQGRARCDLPPEGIRDGFPIAAAASGLSRSPSTSSGPRAEPRGSRSGLHSDPVALRVSAEGDVLPQPELSRSFRSALHTEPCS
jgi:ABC-type multidrug transport system ATPase subunit